MHTGTDIDQGIPSGTEQKSNNKDFIMKISNKEMKIT